MRGWSILFVDRVRFVARYTGGLRALVSHPAEVERGFAHVGLGDVFEDALESVLPALSAPKRSALEAALLFTHIYAKLEVRSRTELARRLR